MSLDVAKENERRLLAAIFAAPDIIKQVCLQVTPDHFQCIPYRHTFQIILEVQASGQAIDELSVYARAEATGRLEPVGGATGLSELSGSVLVPSSWRVYAERIRAEDRRRKMVAIMRNATAEIVRGADTGAIALQTSELLQAVAGEGGGESVPMRDVAVQVYRDLQDADAHPDKRKGVPLHIESVDKAAGVMSAGELIIVAARPSMGKTAFLMSGIVTCNQHTLFVSAEMTRQQLVLRSFSAKTGLTYQQLLHDKIPKDSWPKLAQATSLLCTQSVDVLDRGRMSIARIAEEAYRAKQSNDIKVLAVDYLQLLSAGQKFERRDLEIGEITRALKDLAKDLDLVVIAAAQVGRDVEKNERDKRPRMRHLRESGNIEQDADRVYGLYRHGKYFDRMPEHLMRITELGIEKNRHGPVGKAYLEFNEKTMSFVSAGKELVSEYCSYLESGG